MQTNNSIVSIDQTYSEGWTGKVNEANVHLSGKQTHSFAFTIRNG